MGIKMLKRFLFIFLLFGFIISIPYEVAAAPKKETKKERRERLIREEAARKRRQKTPPKKTITPTFEEKLTPAQVEQKIRTIRKRIETAPESTIPAKYKRVLLEVFDDMAQTQIGRYIFEKAHPNLNFYVKQTGEGVNGSYSYGKQCVNLGKSIFKKIHDAKTPEQKLYEKLYIAHVVAHETTHSIQHSNNMNHSRDMSFEERITINKLFELHSILNETMVRYQIGNLPKYRHMIPTTPEYRSPTETEPGKTSLVPMHLFFKELKEAKMVTGADEKTAERFARTKFVETFWQNNGQTPIQVGSKTVHPTTSNVDEVSRNWNASYNLVSFRNTIGDKRNHQQTMTDLGINKNIQRFINAMEIHSPPSFFRNPKTTSFKMLTSKRFIGYADGIKNLELDALTTGHTTKVYHQGRLFRFLVNTTQKQEAQKDGIRTEYHEGTHIRRATYTYKSGKMNGIYREYDKQGNQIMEVPVTDDKSEGEGWILENGVRSRKRFHPAGILHIK